MIAGKVQKILDIALEVEMLKEVLVIVAVIITFVVLVNIAIVVTGIVTGADEIYCDWILCSISYMNRSAECWLNGEPVPCEEFKEVIGNAQNLR